MTAKIICVFNQKGGVGKTTVACQLAGTFGHRGYDVLVADTDTQRAASRWLSNMGGENFPATLWVGDQYGERITGELAKLSEKYELIVVDCTNAVDDPKTWASLLVCDLAIIPTRLGPQDANALPAAVLLARQAQQQSGVMFPVRILPTAYRKNLSQQRMTLNAMRGLPTNKLIPVMDEAFSDRTVYQTSMECGATVHSMPGAKDTIEEVDALANAVAKLLKIPAVKKGK